MKNGLLFVVGFLFIIAGIRGNLGAILSSVIAPDYLYDTSDTSGSFNAPSSFAQTSYSSSDVNREIDRVFGVYAGTAKSIAMAESSMNPQAYNSISVDGSHAEGLFQILYPSTWSTTRQAKNSPYDVKANVAAAYEIFQRDGYSWREWATAPALGLV